jgi:hypothetical protein
LRNAEYVPLGPDGRFHATVDAATLEGSEKPLVARLIVVDQNYKLLGDTKLTIGSEPPTTIGSEPPPENALGLIDRLSLFPGW